MSYDVKNMLRAPGLAKLPIFGENEDGTAPDGISWQIPSSGDYRIVIDMLDKTVTIYSPENKFNEPFTVTWQPNSNASLTPITTVVTNLWLRGATAGWAKYGKDLKGDDITGEYIGIGKFSKDFMPEFIEHMDRMITTQQHSVWWENILYGMVEEGRSVYIDEMDGLFWAEVDYIEDYERILRFRGFKADFSLRVEKA